MDYQMLKLFIYVCKLFVYRHYKVPAFISLLQNKQAGYLLEVESMGDVVRCKEG